MLLTALVLVDLGLMTHKGRVWKALEGQILKFHKGHSKVSIFC